MAAGEGNLDGGEPQRRNKLRAFRCHHRLPELADLAADLAVDSASVYV